jgi:1-acyl-sn-glycerol-3-phosphate acyltransferase
MREFKSGGFHLAIQAQVPILPATVSGSFELIPKLSLAVHSGRIKVRYGAPIPTRGMVPAQRNELKSLVRDAIARGYDPALQRVPSAGRADAEAGASRVASHTSMRPSA